MLKIKKLWIVSLLLVGVALLVSISNLMDFTIAKHAQVNAAENVKTPVSFKQSLAQKEPPKVAAYLLEHGDDSSAVRWLDEQVRSFFDHKLYHYTESPAHVWHAFEQACHPLPYCTELRALFVRYIDYKEALKVITFTDLSQSNLENALAEMIALQEQYFNEYEINALFYSERITQQQALARRAIQANPDISKHDKQALLIAHLSSLPEAQRHAFAPTVSLSKVVTMLNIDSINDEHYTQLTDQFGADAAQRMLTVHQKQAQWQQRLNIFNQKVNKIRILFEYDLHTQQLEIAHLMRQSFTAQEQKRIKL